MTTLSILASEPLHSLAVDSTRTFSERLTSQISSYSHELRAIGGYWSADITINDSQNKIEDWIEYGLARHIEVYNPALEIVWEGFVNQVIATLGNLQFTIGPLLDIGNRIRVVYSTIDTTVDPPLLGVRESTTDADNTESQELYSIIEKVWGINGATLTQANNLRDAFINDPLRAFPPTSRNSTLSGGGEPSVRLACLGYWHRLKTFYYTEVGTGTDDLNRKIQFVLGVDPNSIISTDFTQIVDNTFQVKNGYSGNETAETVIKRLNSFGDASGNSYTIGIYAGRQCFYQQTPTEIEYNQRIGANIGIADRLDKPLRPWDIQPGKWIFYPDFLVGRTTPTTANTLATDPRAGFNEVVSFDAPNELSVNGIKLSQLDQLLAQRGIGGIA